MRTSGIVLIVAMVIAAIYGIQYLWMKFVWKDKHVVHKPKPSAFSASVNYDVSSIMSYGINKLIALSITIVNRRDMEVGDLQFVAMPGHRLMNYSDVVKMQAQRQPVNILSRVKYTILNAIDFKIGAMRMKSGFLFFETSKDYCDIDSLMITMNNEVKEISIRKDQVLDESIVKVIE